MVKVLQTIVEPDAVADPCPIPFVCVEDWCGWCDGICWVG